MRLCVTHNLWFYNRLMEEIRLALDEDRFEQFHDKWVDALDRRI